MFVHWCVWVWILVHFLYQQFLQVILQCTHVQYVWRHSSDENMSVITTSVLRGTSLSSVISVDRALHPSHILSVIISTTQVSYGSFTNFYFFERCEIIRHSLWKYDPPQVIIPCRCPTMTVMWTNLWDFCTVTKKMYL